jgi:hypothetical protein
METTPRFDLNQTIRQWRDVLSQSATMRAEELDELEHHLRDSMAQLRERQLTEEESFLIATRRLGGGEALAREFAKVNPNRAWQSRLCWMLTGVFLFVSVKSVPSTALLMGLAGQETMPVNGHVLGIIGVLGQWMITLLPVAALWWFLTRKRDFCRHFGLRCLAHPILMSFCLMLLPLLALLGAVFIPWKFGSLVHSSQAMERFQVGQIWQLIGVTAVQYVVLPIVLVLLLRRTLKPNACPGR